MNVAYTPASTSLAFGGFTTQSHNDHGIGQSRTHQSVNQSRWDEDRVIDGPVKLSAKMPPVTETSSITAVAPKKKSDDAKESAKAKLAAAAYDEEAKAKKKTSKSASKSKSKSSKTASKSRRSRTDNDVASYEGRSSRSSGYREDRGSYRPRVAYDSGYSTYGHSDGGRSAGQTMQDNFRPL
ncbi:hypothetical protein [Hyphomicrobium sp. 1Nfss2.1]|uniref:hypothetical protein n=1 Tax=Hyphomicrobium sp. 1Nfss2.1 TaxID=3413936 RepID=UPI003C7D108D